MVTLRSVTIICLWQKLRHRLLILNMNVRVYMDILLPRHQHQYLLVHNTMILVYIIDNYMVNIPIWLYCIALPRRIS
jgi:hypothetical protein